MLIQNLQAISEGDQAVADVKRRAGVASTLQRARLEAVHVAVSAAVLQTHVSGLPAGVSLGPGRIEVQFATVAEALQKLFVLAQAITNDYDRFAEHVHIGPIASTSWDCLDLRAYDQCSNITLLTNLSTFEIPQALRRNCSND